MKKTFIIFDSSGSILALLTKEAKQVVPLSNIIPIPATQGSLLGLMPASGRVLPVLNPSFYLEDASIPNTLGLICEINNEFLILPIRDVVGTVSADVKLSTQKIVNNTFLGFREAGLLNLKLLSESLRLRLQTI